MEEKDSDRITKMREEIDNKLEVILKEIKSNSESTVSNPISETNETQGTQQSGSKINKSIEVQWHASNYQNSDSENDD